MEEFPGRCQQAEREAQTEALWQKYDAITVQDLRAPFDLDRDAYDRLERKGIIETFAPDEPNTCGMIRNTDLPAIKAHLEEEAECKARRKVERDAAKRETRIKL